MSASGDALKHTNRSRRHCVRCCALLQNPAWVENKTTNLLRVVGLSAVSALLLLLVAAVTALAAATIVVVRRHREGDLVPE